MIRKMAGEKPLLSEVKLLGNWSSPFVHRPLIALNLKGVPYEFVRLEPHNVKSELVVKYNPVYEFVPVLLHGDDRAITESMIIVEYIDKFWDDDDSSILLPKDPYELAQARFWAYYIDDKFPAMGAILSGKTEEERAKAADQFLATTIVLEEAFVKCSKGKGFFGGDRVGYVDISLGCFIGWLRVTEKMIGKVLLDGAKTPLLFAWAERFCAEEAVKDVIPDTAKLLDFAKSLYEINKEC